MNGRSWLRLRGAVVLALLAAAGSAGAASGKNKSSSKTSANKVAPKKKPAPASDAPAADPTPVAEPDPSPASAPPPEAAPTAPPAPEPPKRTEATDDSASAATLEKLRAEHAALRDALFRSRARRETLENALLATQLTAVVRWEAGRRYTLKQAELRLDGVRFWDSGDTPPGDRPITLAPRGVPAGAHVLGVRVEVRARDNPKLGYLSEQSFTLSLPEGKKTTVKVTVDEDGSLPSYNPDIEVEIDD